MTTGSSMHTAHQGAAKNLAKCEFVLGVALHMTQTLGNAHLPHSEERLGELMMYTELMRACMRAAEADAELDRVGRDAPRPRCRSRSRATCSRPPTRGWPRSSSCSGPAAS